MGIFPFGKMIAAGHQARSRSPAQNHMSILLNPDLEHRIALKVESGRYRSPDEVVQESLDLLEARDAATESAPAHDPRPVWKIIRDLGQQVPPEELAKLPTDLAKNLDHYLHGAPKVSE